MGFIRSLLHAAATASAMSAERAKSNKIIALLDEGTAGIYANADTCFAPVAAALNVPDLAARVARHPKVITATSAIKALRDRAFEARHARNPDYELDLAGFAVPGALDDLSKALRDAYARVLFVGQTVSVCEDGSKYILVMEVTAVSPFDLEPDEFTGRVQSVFTVAGDEIEEGATALKGQEVKFKKADIVSEQGALKAGYEKIEQIKPNFDSPDARAAKEIIKENAMDGKLTTKLLDNFVDAYAAYINTGTRTDDAARAVEEAFWYAVKDLYLEVALARNNRRSAAPRSHRGA
jgi:hypothetical protein